MTSQFYLGKILALPLLHPEHILQAFRTITLNVVNAIVLLFVDWLENSKLSVHRISVFKQFARTNNDVEGWHRRLSARACRGHLPLLIKLIQCESRNAGLQVILSEGKIRWRTKMRYAEINKKLHFMCVNYETGKTIETDISPIFSGLQGVY